MAAGMIAVDNVVATVAATAEVIVPDKAVAAAEQILCPFMHLKLNNKVLYV